MLVKPVHNIIGQPSTKNFMRCIEQTLLLNLPIIKADILHTEDI